MLFYHIDSVWMDENCLLSGSNACYQHTSKPPAELYFTNRNTADLVLVLKYSFLKILPGNCLLTEFDSVIILSETYGLLAANMRHEQLRTIMGFNVNVSDFGKQLLKLLEELSKELSFIFLSHWNTLHVKPNSVVHNCFCETCMV